MSFFSPRNRWFKVDVPISSGGAQELGAASGHWPWRRMSPVLLRAKRRRRIQPQYPQYPQFLRMKFAMKMTMKSFNSPFLSCFWTGLVSQHPLDGSTGKSLETLASVGVFRTRNRWMTRCQGLGGLGGYSEDSATWVFKRMGGPWGKQAKRGETPHSVGCLQRHQFLARWNSHPSCKSTSGYEENLC